MNTITQQDQEHYFIIRSRTLIQQEYEHYYIKNTNKQDTVVC